MTIPNYAILRNDRMTHGGGVAMYIKNDIKYKDRSDIYTKHNIESCWIELTGKENKNLLVGTIYRPPSANVDYYNRIIDMLNQVSTECKDIVLLGDFNLDYFSYKGKSVKALETMFDMSQLITSATRVSTKVDKNGVLTNRETLIDILLTTVPQHHHGTCVIDTTLSDHFLIKSKVRFIKEVCHKTVTFRDYKNFNCENFNKDLDTIFHNYQSQDVNDVEKLWLFFRDSFNEVSNRHAPLVTRRLKSKSCPWITTDIVKLIHERDYAHKSFRKTHNQSYWDNYKHLRNQVTSLIRNTKRSFYENEINNNLGNASHLWKVINGILPTKSKHLDSSIFTPSQFNNHFCKIGEYVANSFIDCDKSYPWKGPNSIHQFKFSKIKQCDVEKLLNDLPMKSSLDILNIDSKLLKIGAKYISKILTHIFNVSMDNGIVCNDWKMARVSPSYKNKGSKSDMNNYRPISNISHIAKVIERLINKQFMKYLSENNFISESQSAYRPEYSTVTALHRVMEDWLDALNDSQYIGVVYLDTKKCFDSINHEILLHKLSRYGVLDVEHRWFTSYLHNRKQKVLINNNYSDEGLLKTGVPQGSILGPTLFLLFINDLPQYGLKATINIYADDVLVYFASEDVTQLNGSLQKSLNSVNNWYTENKLLLNPDKCGTILISNKKTDGAVLKLQLGDTMLLNVDSFEYLGLKIDNQLNFNLHVQSKVSSMKSKLSSLRRLSSILPINILKKLYKVTILPSLDYAISVWGSTSNNNIELIEKQQKLAARIILNDFDYRNSRGQILCNSLGFKPFIERYKYTTSCLIYKCVHGSVPTYLSDHILFEFEVHNYQTRGAINNNLYLPLPKKEKYKQSIFYNGAIFWNSLNDFIRDSHNIDAFKRNYLNFLVNG